MKRFEQFLDKWIPELWFFLIMLAISLFGVGVVLVAFKWILNILEVL